MKKVVKFSTEFTEEFEITFPFWGELPVLATTICCKELLIGKAIRFLSIARQPLFQEAVNE
jgi:hypothetical protein